MVNSRDPVHEYIYNADDSVQYGVFLTTGVAAAGRFVLATSPLPGLPPFSKMRHIGLVSGTKRDRIPFALIANEYLNGGTVSLNGLTWAVTGRSGEKVRIPH